MSDLVVARNCCLARILPREAELVSDGLLWGAKSVKRFERSKGLDPALYKNIPLPFYCRVFQMALIHTIDHKATDSPIYAIITVLFEVTYSCKSSQRTMTDTIFIHIHYPSLYFDSPNRLPYIQSNECHSHN